MSGSSRGPSSPWANMSSGCRMGTHRVWGGYRLSQWLLGAGWLLAALGASVAMGQRASDGLQLTANAWPTEKLGFKGEGRAPIEGMVMDSTEDEIEFIEICRSSDGRRYVVRRWFPRDSVILPVTPLTPGQRKTFLDNYDRFRFRTRLEARRVDSIQLQRL